MNYEWGDVWEGKRLKLEATQAAALTSLCCAGASVLVQGPPDSAQLQSQECSARTASERAGGRTPEPEESGAKSGARPVYFMDNFFFTFLNIFGPSGDFRALSLVLRHRKFTQRILLYCVERRLDMKMFVLTFSTIFSTILFNKWLRFNYHKFSSIYHVKFQDMTSN